MKSKFLLVLLLSIFFINLNAQDISIDWGNASPETGKKFNPKSFIAKDDSYIYLLKHELKLTSGPNIYIEKYSIGSLTRIYSKKIDSPNSIISFILLKDKLLVLTAEKKKNNYILHATEISSNGILSDKSTKIMECEFKPMGDYYEIGYDDFFTYFSVYFDDINKILYASPATIENGIIPICKMDKNMTIEEKTYSSPLSEKGLIKMVVQDEKAIMMVRTLPSQRNKKDPIRYDHSCVTINMKTKDIKLKQFELENQMTPCEILIKEDDDKKNVYFCGFFNSGKEYKSESKGFFCSKINILNAEKASELNYTYDDKVLNAFLYKNDENLAKNRLITDLEFQHIIAKEDGGLILLFEKNYTGMNGKYYTYIADNILVLNLKNDLKLKNMTIIPKAQQGDSWGDGKFNSYCHIYKNDNLYLIYNDSPKNFDGSLHGKIEKRVMTYRFGNSSDLTVAKVTIDATGEWRKDELQNMMNNQAFLCQNFLYKSTKTRQLYMLKKMVK